MPTRYNNRKIIVNNSEYYEPIRQSRGRKAIVQYSTGKLKNPTITQRSRTKTSNHIWKYGDRLYNLSHKFYGDPQYWWVIAWWNGYGIEADIKTGATLSIPLNIERALTVLGV
jgi:nucleoid-associated protein YgaU